MPSKRGAALHSGGASPPALAPVHESPCGTFPTWRDVRRESVMSPKADFVHNRASGLRKNPVGPGRGVVRESDARTQTRR
jgi:hypothetical protein